MMNATEQATADALYRERVLRARQMTGEERMLEGVRMFDRECEAMKLDIMRTNSTFTEADAKAEVRRRIRAMKVEEEAEIRRLMPIPLPR